MSVVINSNYASTIAANNLAAARLNLQRSLNRLSSGSRIVNPADDAGGLAVSMKLSAAAIRQGAVANNIGNEVSFLQTQDGVLGVTGKILNRISELKVLYGDVTKSSSDRANYQTEFAALQTQITANGAERFNGVSLFGTNTQNVITTENGTGAVSVQGVALLGAAGPSSTFSDNFAGLSNWTDTSTGGGAVTTGSGVAFNDGGGAASITSQATFSGATTIQFDITSGDAQVDLGGTFLNGFIGFGGSTIKLVLDGTGNMQTFVDNVSIGTTGGQPTSGALKLYAVPVGQGGSGIGNITNFSVSSSSGGGGGGSGNVAAVSSASDLASLSLSSITVAIQDVATYRAQNGASQSRLGFAAELLTVNKTNLEAATSRITDVDVAEESTSLARYNILVQAGTAMLSQANQSAQSALRLIS